MNAKAKYYAYTVKDSDGTLLQDLVPARRNSDNVLGMLDLVSGAFLTNAGTGTFTAGADVGPIGGTCSAVGSGYYAAATTVGYGSVAPRSTCPTNYGNSAAGAATQNDCYLTTTATNYVASAGAGQTTCAANGYCPGGTTVYYNGTGGRTACTSPYSLAATGQDDANDCYLTTTATKYVATAGAGETTCVAGAYCAGGTTVYKGGSVSGRATTGGIAVCATDKYSNAGASSCTACGTANGYHNSGSAYAAHAGVKSCVATCGAGTYVSTSGGACGNVGAGFYMPAHTVKQTETDTRGQCPTGLTTIGYGMGADSVGDCGHIFHADAGTLYLRSVKKTDPSLNVKIDGKTFYGNMSTSAKNMSAGTSKQLKVKSGGTTYYVHDDSTGQTSEVPSGYTQVEYIQSSGNNYINTGFVPNADFKHTLVFESVSSSNTSKYICGTGVNEGRSGNVRINGNTIDGLYINVGSGAAVNILNGTKTLSGKTTLVMDLHGGAQNTVLLNGQSVANTNTGTVTSTKPLQLFALDTGYLATGIRIYSSVIEQNGVVVHNFIPARNSSNVCGMYDTVSGTFKTSATSTAFTCP